ncbi:stage II sporulation protein M [Lacrimispora aerotolerans]|jgi:stage II sporulation protein M|uniref:stage II sporulation protein M n=1 Tax=Lacrimispora aerotolerans TaxID=36832 RepID=UPI00047DE9D1|nr:stage II sporulation protein M [Lacrimispora aerotolerans]
MASLLQNIRLRFGRRTDNNYMKVYRSTRTWDIYLICFFIGLTAGTVMANLWYSSFADEAGYYLGLLNRNVNLGKDERMQLFGQVVSQRVMEVWIIWLIGMTAYALPLFCTFMGLAGFSMGFVLSVITVQKGLMGLPIFFMTIMPQSLCYLPVFGILLFWGIQKERRFRIPALILLLLLTAAGSAFEAWINPFFLKFVL